MKRIFIFAAMALLACACAKTIEQGELTEYPQEQKKSETFVSKVTGLEVSYDAVNAGSIYVKLADSFCETVEAVGADVKVLATKSKAVEAPFEKIRPVRMERVFPEAGEFEARTRAAGLHKWYKVEFDPGVSVSEAEAVLADVSEFECVELDYKICAEFDNTPTHVCTPEEMAATNSDATSYFDDPMLSKQWHYYNDGSQKGMVAGCDINVLPVWEQYSPGNSDVVVSVVDGGVDYKHPDLEANMWQDATGHYGYNFVDNNSVITAENHGTHVAGTIAAVNNNGVGVCGIAGGDYGRGIPGVKIQSCQIFEGDNSASGASAIKWGADHGAVISQNSWGYTDNDGKPFTKNYVPQIFKDAVDYFNDNAGFDRNGVQEGPMAGGVVIFSAGNENNQYGSPSSYEGVVSVSSVGADFIKAYYSCYGEWCDIVAPGGDANKGYEIRSTLPNGGYGDMQGTSMACPHVSGVAALIVANLGGPGFTAAQLKTKLLGTTDEKVLRYNSVPMGVGMVNAGNAVSGDRPLDHIVSPENAKTLSMRAWQTRQIAFSVKNPTGHTLKFSLEPALSGFSVKADPKDTRRILVEVNGPKAIGSESDIEHRWEDIRLTVSCEREPEKSYSTTFNVTVDKNNPPFILKEITGKVFEKLGDAQKIDISGHFFDSDGETLSYEIANTTLGSFDLEGTQLKFTPAAYGHDEVEITARDFFGASITAKVPILVRDGSRGAVDFYPNPVVDYLNIRSSDISTVFGSVQIYSLGGGEVYSGSVEFSAFAPASIDLKNLPAGSYTLKLKTDKLDIKRTIVKL